MSARGIDLLNRASSQLAEATELVGMLTESELGRMCPDRSGDDAGTTSARPLADLTDQQLESVPDGSSTPFSDGRRTRAEVLDAAIAHQSEHLAALKRAVG